MKRFTPKEEIKTWNQSVSKSIKRIERDVQIKQHNNFQLHSNPTQHPSFLLCLYVPKVHLFFCFHFVKLFFSRISYSSLVWNSVFWFLSTVSTWNAYLFFSNKSVFTRNVLVSVKTKTNEKKYASWMKETREKNRSRTYSQFCSRPDKKNVEQKHEWC